MPDSTGRPGKNKDELNVGQRNTDQLTDQLLRTEKKGTATKNNTNPGAGGEDSAATGAPKGNWADKTNAAVAAASAAATGPAGAGKAVAEFFFKGKRKAATGSALAIAVITGVLFAFFGSMFGLQSLSANLLDHDPASRAIHARFMKNLDIMTNNPDEACKPTTFTCKAKRISNSGLAALAKANIYAVDAAGNRIDTTQSGYPERNPTAYEIDTSRSGNGTDVTRVPAAELGKYLNDNPTHKARLLGTSGVFNATYRSWTSKHLSKFLDKAGVKKNGGVADGENKKLSSADKKSVIKEKLAKVIPSFNDSSGSGTNRVTLKDKIGAATSKKVTAQLDRAGKGGVGYMVAVSTCIAIKVPKYFAAGVAAVQLAQVLPVVNELILSPSAKASASGGDPNVKFTAEDMETTMTILNEEYPNEDGEMNSALDSPILQSALGVNTAKPAVAEEYTPGYSALTSGVVAASVTADAATKGYCDALMSPAAMYSAMAVDAAVTVAASATVIGGLAKIAGSWLVTELAIAAAKPIVEGIAIDAFTQLVQSDTIAEAKGEDLGHVIGNSYYALTSGAGAARHLSVISEADMDSAEQVAMEVEEDKRQMAVASLSPFDISSRYTFMGNIVYNANMAVIANGVTNGNWLSKTLAVMKTPFSASVVSADYVQSYSAEFGYASNSQAQAEGLTYDPSEVPCITVAGTPCYELTSEQNSYSAQQAMATLIDEGWIDDTVEIPEDAILDDLVGNAIKSDTPLSDHMSTCGDITTGDYLFSATGCIAQSSTKSADEINTDSGSFCEGEDDARSCPTDAVTGGDTGISDGNSINAIAPALIDYQIRQMINGNDEPEDPTAAAGGNLAPGTYVLPTDQGYNTPGSGQDWGPRACNGCSTFHRGVDITGFAGGSMGKPVYAIADGKVTMANPANGSGNSCQGGIGNAPYSTNNPVHIQLNDGTEAVYLHMAPGSITVREGDSVTAGQQIGTINNCGQSFGAHLHFAMMLGSATDPAITSLEQSANGWIFINPVAYMNLYGIDVMNGTYTDGR